MALKDPCSKPCVGCPFSKTGPKGDLGGSPIETYVGQIHLPMWLPCHMSKNYRGKMSDPNEVTQCSGAARFRKKLLTSKPVVDMKVPLHTLALQEDPEHLAFDTVFEFIRYHTNRDDMSDDQITEAMMEQWRLVAANQHRTVHRIPRE